MDLPEVFDAKVRKIYDDPRFDSEQRVEALFKLFNELADAIEAEPPASLFRTDTPDRRVNTPGYGWV